METASLLAIISGVCWATNITIVKWALNRSRAWLLWEQRLEYPSLQLFV